VELLLFEGLWGGVFARGVAFAMVVQVLMLEVEYIDVLDLGIRLEECYGLRLKN